MGISGNTFAVVVADVLDVLATTHPANRAAWRSKR